VFCLFFFFSLFGISWSFDPTSFNNPSMPTWCS
jgi:hypothetical protein